MSTETEAPTETAKTYRGYRDFTDPMMRAATAQSTSDGGEQFKADTLRWLGYADQELTRLRELRQVSLDRG